MTQMTTLASCDSSNAGNIVGGFGIATGTGVVLGEVTYRFLKGFLSGFFKKCHPHLKGKNQPHVL